MHHIVARAYIDKELMAGTGRLLQQPALLDEAEDFGIGEEVGIAVHHPALSQQALNQGQRAGRRYFLDFGEGRGDNIFFLEQLREPAGLVADDDDPLSSGPASLWLSE